MFGFFKSKATRIREAVRRAVASLIAIQSQAARIGAAPDDHFCLLKDQYFQGFLSATAFQTSFLIVEESKLDEKQRIATLILGMEDAFGGGRELIQVALALYLSQDPELDDSGRYSEYFRGKKFGAAVSLFVARPEFSPGVDVGLMIDRCWTDELRRLA